MSFYVYSTATNSGTYVEYEKNAPNELAIPKKWPNGKPMKVTIKGGHGLAQRGNSSHIYTPRGMVTQVTDDEMEMLLNNKSFQRHMDKGFMSYDKKKVSAEKKAANMEEMDGSAPLTMRDYEETEDSTPSHKIYKSKRVLVPELG
jgi:hypothetical protein